MFMAKSNGKQEEDNTNIVRVGSVLSLPYAYIPYHSIANARVNHPEDTLYVFEPGKPVGYKIVAFPILMNKPEDGEEGADE
jgi:hypothetical protein